MHAGPHDAVPAVAVLIERADAGDVDAISRLFATLYDELHRLAEREIRRQRGDFTLGATSLLHEAYLGLSASSATFPDRSRFFAYAARAMRGLVVDHARRRHAAKRGGEAEITLIGERELAAVGPTPDLEALSEAVAYVHGLDPRLGELIDQHIFCGFTLVELAAMRGVTERTVQRDWQKARLLLRQRLDTMTDRAVS
jgi:RNA polymerase sigma factor (TIGR02999 family)